MTAHWGIADPAAAQGSEVEVRKAFFTAYNQLNRRITFFTALPLVKLEGIALQRELDNIGKLREKGE